MQKATPFGKWTTTPAMREIIKDVQNGCSPGDIGGRFHETIVQGFVRAVLAVRDDTGINQVVLSGGVFNNSLILSGMLKCLEHHGLGVYTHAEVTCR